MPEIRMNSLKSLAMNCGPLSEMSKTRATLRDPGPRFRVKFLGALQDDLDVRLGHRLPQIPVHDVATAAVVNAAQVVERPADVDVRHVDMPVLIRCQRLLKARALLR